MSIFHTLDISEKPSSYTHGFAVKEVINTINVDKLLSIEK
jgi:hypothetical protein